MENFSEEKKSGFVRGSKGVAVLLFVAIAVVLGGVRVLVLQIDRIAKNQMEISSGIASVHKDLGELNDKYERIASSGGRAQPAEPRDPVDIKLAQNDPYLGSPKAKVVFVEFADFQCPFCGSAFKTIIPELKAKYVTAGKIKFYYKNFAFLGDESVLAAEAAKCAGDQGKFWEYHDYLYNHQKGENQGAFLTQNLKQFAKSLGLKSSDFDSCMDGHKHASEVKQETETARKDYVVSGTPTFFVNGKRIVGIQPLSVFQEKIDKELSK